MALSAAVLWSRFLIAFVLVAGLASAAIAGDNTPPDGFTALFSGKDLTGWKGLVKDPPTRAKMSKDELAAAQVDANKSMREHWSVKDGELQFDGKGENLCTVEEYGDFELLLDWKIPPGGDSGIYVRGSPQVQIWDNPEGSGGLYNNQKNPRTPVVVADKKPGEWNHFRIIIVAARVTVYLNEQLVVDNTMLENYWERDKPIYATGAIELQNHGGTLFFKNIYVRRLASAAGRTGNSFTEDGRPAAEIVPSPPTDRSNSHYIGNRVPLAPSPLVKLPIGSIKPQGWLRGQLDLMRSGMTGNLENISKWCKFEGSAWSSPTGDGDFGWEELPYWLKGYGDLGYVLGDEEIKANAKKWIDAVLAGQGADGYLGPRSNRKQRDVWPNMPFLNTLQTYFEHTGDKRVLDAMARYFKWQASIPRDQLLPDSWQKVRAGDNIESIFWLYNRTGDASLLDLARTLHAGTIRWDKGVANWHGVNICQGFREPAVFWMLSKNGADLGAAERNYTEVMSLYGQVPGGMFGADENCRRGYGDPRQGAETCSMVEFMHSFQMLAGITGSPLYGDRCEDVAFNSLPAAFTPDYKGLHYLTAPNQVQLDKENKAPGIENSGTMFSYDPHDYRCCQHNHAFGWPYYAEHLWMGTSDDGLATLLYSQSEVTAKVGAGENAGQVTIAQQTDYPFDENISLTIKAARPVKFPLYLRIPAWCAEPFVSVNSQAVGFPGGTGARFVRVERQWVDGDAIHINFPMEIAVRRWEANKNAVSVSRGPLTYSLRIGEKQIRYGGTDEFPAYEVFPTTPWNYGLVLDTKNPESSFATVRKTGILSPQPFTNHALIEITAKARRLPGWTLDRRGLVTPLQQSPAKSTEPVEEVTLVPMGGARLRISAFPVIGDGPDAHEWKPPAPSRHAASHENDDINALSDGILPKASSDHSVPRFTFWSHRGTTEWVTYSFGTPRKISECSVYWFNDTGMGQCRVPSSWTLYFKGPDGFSWQPVTAAGPFGTAPNTMNTVRFEPLTTTALKLEAKLQDGFSGGILEWAVAP